jgi:hypothetical protein
METPARIRLAGLIGAIALGASVSLGEWSALGPPIFAGVLFLGVLAAEVALPRPARGRVASATLRERRVIDYLPQTAARGLAALAGALLGLAFFGILAGLVETQFSFQDGIDLRAILRYGYSGEWQYGIGYGVTATASSALITIVASLAAGLLLLRLVVRSPRAGSDAEQRRLDEAWRRRTAAVIIAALGVLISGLVAGGSFYFAAHVAPYESLPFFTFLAATVGAIGLAAFSGYVVMLLRAGESPAETEPEPAPESEDEPALAARP